MAALAPLLQLLTSKQACNQLLLVQQVVSAYIQACNQLLLV